MKKILLFMVIFILSLTIATAENYCDGQLFANDNTLCWQNNPPHTTLNWDDAKSYCESLDTAGLDWNLPEFNFMSTLLQSSIQLGATTAFMTYLNENVEGWNVSTNYAWTIPETSETEARAYKIEIGSYVTTLKSTERNYLCVSHVAEGFDGYVVYGCMDEYGANYNEDATLDDGSCTYNLYGCFDEDAMNYYGLTGSYSYMNVLNDDGSCLYNVDGWDELMEGKLVLAAFTMFNNSLNGWFIAIIFFTFQILLFIKTKNVTLTWVSGLFFASLYASTAFMNDTTNYIMFISLVFQLAGILFLLLLKNK